MSSQGPVPKHAQGPPDASAVDFEKGEGRATPAPSAFKPLLCPGVPMFNNAWHCLKAISFKKLIELKNSFC